MWKQLKISVRMMIAMTLLTGVIYPLAVTAIASLTFPDRAKGSLIISNGSIVGSKLIAQKFASEKYFHPRPSAVDYNGLSSGGSNLGLTSKKMAEQMAAGAGSPEDLVFASGSGLDPHVSKAGAEFQVARVASARGINAETIRALVASHLEPRQFGFLGEPRINVLELNLALDQVNERR